jgi:hypothetical protein
MKSMIFTAGLSLVTAALLAGLSSRGLSNAGRAELTSALGGACYVCGPESTCNQNSCTASGAYWAKMVGTGITPVYCFPAASGATGNSSCTTNMPQNCVNTYTCTDNKCNNCGFPATETKDTNCSVSGYQCTG